MITGKEADLTALLVAEIEAGITAKCGAAPISPKCIDGLAEGIAKAIIPFLVANTVVNPGNATLVPVTGAPGTPSPGTVVAPTTIS